MVLALAGGSWIFLAVVLVFLAAVIYGFWTVRGSGINLREHKRAHGGQGGGPPRVGSADGDKRRVSYSRGTSAGRGLGSGGSARGRRGTRPR